MGCLFLGAFGCTTASSAGIGVVVSADVLGRALIASCRLRSGTSLEAQVTNSTTLIEDETDACLKA